MLLALDTSTAYVTVCVATSAGEVLAERSGIGPQQHGEQLAPAIAAVLAEAGVARTNLSAIVVGVGPGPYTGLRVGLVTARVLGATLGIPVRGVVSLDALASGAVADGLAEPFVATLDARRKEVFWAAYSASGDRLDGPHVDKPAHVPTAGRPVVGAGPALYPADFPQAADPRDPSAADLVRVAMTRPDALVGAEPVYLRRPDAVALAAHRSVT